MAATRHLADLGHRRIAAIGGPERFWSVHARLDGYRTALLRSGLPVDEALVGRDEFYSVAGARLEALRLLDLPDGPPRSWPATTTRRSACSRRWPSGACAPPDDVSVVGFDDVLATWATPPLTTVRQPLAAMAAAGFRMLRAESGPTAPEHVEMATTLVVRESTGCAPALVLAGITGIRDARFRQGGSPDCGGRPRLWRVSDRRWISGGRRRRSLGPAGLNTCAALPRQGANHERDDAEADDHHHVAGHLPVAPGQHLHRHVEDGHVRPEHNLQRYRQVGRPGGGRWCLPEQVLAAK